MKKDELLDAIGDIDERYVRQASENEDRKKNPKPWAAVAACLFLAALGLVSVWFLRERLQSQRHGEHVSAEYGEAETSGNAMEGSTDRTAEISTEQTESAGQSEGTEQSEGKGQAEGIYIPPLEIPESSGMAEMDMIAFVVYQGGIYTQNNYYTGEETEWLESLVGEYLGYAKGNIDEWSTQDEYATEFASSIPGDVYAVNGYDTSFRICVRQELEGADGKPIVWIQFLDRLNGITIAKGEDLFEERLHLSGHIASIEWQDHDDWNYNRGNEQEASFDEADWDAFLEALDQGEFFNAWMPERSFYEDHPNSSIYDNPNQVHLILRMEDGTIVRLRLIEGGYVGYESVGWWYFVQMPEDEFNKIYDACEGPHLTDWTVAR